MHETAYLKRKDNSMKKYEKPLLDIIEFENLDVIMESVTSVAVDGTSTTMRVEEEINIVSDTPLGTQGETTPTTVPETPEAAPETTPMEQENSPLDTPAPEVSDSMQDSVVEPTEPVEVPEVTPGISEEADPGVL